MVIKKAIASLLGNVPAPWLRRMNKHHFLLPYQHTVSNAYLPHVAEIYPYKNVAQFEQDIKYLKKYSNDIPLRSLLDLYVQRRPLPKGSVILSFDDGFREIYDTVVPILKQYQLEAIFFVNPAFINNQQLFYRNQISLVLAALKQKKDLLHEAGLILQCQPTMEVIRTAMLAINNSKNEQLQQLITLTGIDIQSYMATQRPYLTTDQLQSIANDGFLIGAHSYTHPYYHLLPLEQQLAETVESMNWVVSQVQPSHRVFSFPHSDAGVSARFFEQMPANCVDIYFGTQNMKQELRYPVLHRYNAERPAPTLHQQTALVSSFTAFGRLFGKHIVNRSAS